MGEVYRADDLELGQPVALKFLTGPAKAGHHGGFDERAHTRLRNEVRLARRISHPNVCRVYDIGEAHGELYLSMEYVDGEDLAALLKRIGRLPIDKGIEIARKLGAGLAAAHTKGVLHRDFKPANIMIDSQGEVRIMDFGLAAVASDLDADDVRSGTPAYMAPEQLAGKEATRQSDFYSLGLVLFELFTGKPPFPAQDLHELQRLREGAPSTTPSTLIPDITPRLERAILRCLEPDPKLRPSSALEVAASLPGGDPLAEALAAGETPSPEMVAAAGPTEGLKPRIGLALIAWIAIGVAITLVVTPQVQTVAMLPWGEPPNTLTVRARDIARSLGYTTPVVDSAVGFVSNSDHLNYLGTSIAGTRLEKRQRWRQALALHPSPVSFWYREGTTSLVGARLDAPFARATREDPPLDRPGMTSVVTDLQGHLLRLTTIPDVRESANSMPGTPDWSKLFVAAGLDLAQFTATAPTSSTTFLNDARYEWTGRMPARADLPIRVQAAALRGRVTSFELQFPWSSPTTFSSPPYNVPVVTGILALLMLSAIVLAARYNVIKNRSDVRGAYRLGAFFGGATLLGWIVGAPQLASDEALGYLLQVCLAEVVFNAAITALVYLAIEPWVRRYWPQTMITWSRLIAGRWRDPVVARDILVGTAWGLVSTLSFRVPALITFWLGGPPAPPTMIFSPFGFGLEKLLSGRLVAADAVAHLLQGYAAAMQTFFVLFLLRMALRKPWLAAVASFLFFVALYGPAFDARFGVAYGTIAIVVALRLFVAMRFGVVATISFTVMGMLTDGFLLTTNLREWYGLSSLVGIVIVGAVSAWAFRTSLAGRSVFNLQASSS
jgi:serine/threonine-protein kinase